MAPPLYKLSPSDASRRPRCGQPACKIIPISPRAAATLRASRSRAPEQLGAPAPALISVIMIHTWQWTPFAFLVFLASLASLPPDVYEAARIDRAGPVQRFIHITLPLIRPALVIVVIMRSMIALSAFAAIFASTRGGPGTATEILNLYAYRTSFVELNFGYGSALAVALLVITLAVSGVLFALRTARVSQ